MALPIKPSVSFRKFLATLLQLYNLWFPSTWTSSTIVPLPKSGTARFRHISLSSSFSKVFVRILLAWLMHRLHDKLSLSLYGFRPRRSTHKCLAELYILLSPTIVVGLFDLESAFGIATREIILDQLVELGVQENLLLWIHGYFCDRVSRVTFKGACSSYEQLELGTAQGGVRSPFLFSVLRHSLLSLLPAIHRTTIMCYADDTCIHFISPTNLQRFLHDFYVPSISCGLIISPEKSRIFPPVTTGPCRRSQWVGLPPLTAHIYTLASRSGSLQLYPHDNVFTPL